MHGAQRGCLLNGFAQRRRLREDFGNQLGDLKDSIDQLGAHMLEQLPVLDAREHGRVRHQLVERGNRAVPNQLVNRTVRVLGEHNLLFI